MARRRLDDELVRRRLVASRDEAVEVVSRGRVLVGGSRTDNPATQVAPSASVYLVGDPRPYVSRGGSKLEAALERFEIDPTGLDCLDAGSSTGGWTDRLLRSGAARVIAVDVSYGQLAWSLRKDPRVTAMERTNVRFLTPAELPFRPQLVVADLSFISLGHVLSQLASLATAKARFVTLVKPQFEAARSEVEPGGVVSDPEVWTAVLTRVRVLFEDAGIRPTGVMASPLKGPAGNVEFLMSGSRPSHDGPGIDIPAAIREGIEVRDG
jgi:23S rRNA (cytidine1920-2'-O)/16S rRNA (cytidine1409-2'-O)-methyltransferase